MAECLCTGDASAPKNAQNVSKRAKLTGKKVGTCQSGVDILLGVLRNDDGCFLDNSSMSRTNSTAGEEEEDDDCRIKKRCSDRYDSSESSDSGVAVLSCTDCSGSSTASSDITDPGSPFSTASNHSEDSAVHQPAKMPPAAPLHHNHQHHPPWSWMASECSAIKTIDQPIRPALPSSTHDCKTGKITDYFKGRRHPPLGLDYFFSQKKPPAAKKCPKSRKTPRKILPAPSKLSPNGGSFSLTALAIPSGLAYLQHAKVPEPPDNYVVQQLALTDGSIPTLVRAPCLNAAVLQPLNNFFKPYTTVVPIVKINSMPADLVAIVSKPKITENVVATAGVHSLPTQPIASPIVLEAETVESLRPIAETQLKVATNSEPDSAVVESQKSPILSQPKTIRFPAKQSDHSEYKDRSSSSSTGAEASLCCCQWTECSAQFDTSGALLEHLQVKHVISQATQEQYECLWLGCKVHGRKSCSRSWLERHVLAHAGTKPFRCIFDGCGTRFNSQLALQRHVNGHFNADGTQNSSAKKSVDGGSVKMFKRNGKKLRFRRQPWSARMFDFFDNGIMEGLQHRLLAVTEARTRGLGESSVPGENILLTGQIVARRIESDGKCKVLLRWHPADILPDEWAPEKDSVFTKTVPIRTLEPTALNRLLPILFPFRNAQLVRRKQRRKPDKDT